MSQFQYRLNFNGLRVIKTKEEQHDRFFYKGHPEFLIPDFCTNSILNV